MILVVGLQRRYVAICCSVSISGPGSQRRVAKDALPGKMENLWSLFNRLSVSRFLASRSAML